MKRYSHSKLNTFDSCKKQFYYRYIEKLKSDREGIEEFVGKLVHSVLERLYYHIMVKHEIPTINQLKSQFDKEWLDGWHPDIIVVKRGKTSEDYKDLGRRCLENYYRKNYPFSDITLGLEMKIGIQFEDFLYVGVIDRIAERDGVVSVVDYKTTGRLPKQSDVDEDKQLASYALGLIESENRDFAGKNKRVPTLKWEFVAFGETLTSTRSPEQLEELKKDIQDQVDVIEAATEFPASPSFLCNWCQFSDICDDSKAHT